MRKTLDFFFDVGSPASWLAFTQVGAMAREAGAALRYRPMLLGGVFQATGNASPASVPAKGAYTFIDFDRFAKRYGVPLHRNPHFPIHTLGLMRAVTGMQMRHPEHFEPFTRAVFEAIWVQSLNFNDAQVVASALSAAGYAPEWVLPLMNDPEVKAQLKATTDEAVARGVFGAPTLFVGEQMFWGQDRLDWVREALRA
ncbi:MAG: 2-hydroxychromene-2-carboxylate isomerase [Pseudomonadota bacterium]|nr:2-hydroxychromene-2-carboxylate isomerase [Pseudomonadota bacterium]